MENWRHFMSNSNIRSNKSGLAEGMEEGSNPLTFAIKGGRPRNAGPGLCQAFAKKCG
jgi:hypothetical protein